MPTHSHTAAYTPTLTPTQTKAQTDRQTDRQTDERTDGRTDKQTCKFCVTVCLCVSECFCERVCLCERKKERKRGGERERKKKRERGDLLQLVLVSTVMVLCWHAEAGWPGSGQGAKHFRRPVRARARPAQRIDSRRDSVEERKEKREETGFCEAVWSVWKSRAGGGGHGEMAMAWPHFWLPPVLSGRRPHNCGVVCHFGVPRALERTHKQKRASERARESQKTR